MVDFFLSYTSPDTRWAEWVAWTIEAAGFTVTLQAWDFVPGSNFALAMQKAATNAECTIALLSPDYLKSRFGSAEWAAAFAQDPEGLERKLIPIKIRECSTAGLLKTVVYIDIVGVDEVIARRRVLDGIRKTRAKPLRKPQFPGASDQVTTSQASQVFPPPIDTTVTINLLEELSDMDTRFPLQTSYTISFTLECDTHLKRFALSRDQLIELVQQEFRSHLNYFRFDLEDYIMPLKSRYLLYLDKIGPRLSFKALYSCTNNEAKLSSWNDVLSLYRRATRLPYRRDPRQIVLQKGLLKMALNLQREMEARIVKHIDVFEGISVDPVVVQNCLAALEICRKGGEENELPKIMAALGSREETWSTDIATITEISFHLEQARNARNEARTASDMRQSENFPIDNIVGPVVISLERALQHIHKILLRYPPTQEIQVR